MSKLFEIVAKIRRKWTKIRLQPIRVFCLHHVCAEFDAESMNACDWTDMDDFKQRVLTMRQDGVEFISLTKAYQYIRKDRIRRKKYAVLTFDDGYSSLKEILPWLNEQHITVTLFINGKYLDGKSYRKNPKEKYLTKEELMALNSPLIEIASHGWEHNKVTDMTDNEFVASADRDVELLRKHPNYVPFWAYTYGVHTDKTDAYLRERGIVPIYIDGKKNYNEVYVIHRELL